MKPFKNFLQKIKNWWSSNKYDFLSFLKFIFICAVVVYVAMGIGNLVIKQGCKNQARVMQVEYHYGFFEGCMFELGDSFIPSDQYFLVKNLEDNNE